MLNLRLCDYSEPFKLVERTVRVAGQRIETAAIAADRNSEQ